MAANEVLGTILSDRLIGSPGDDIIYGFAGADILSGEGGNDILYGGNDGDSLEDGYGDDTLYGEQGNDHLYTTTGSDNLYGGEGNDEINAANRVDVGTHDVILDGGSGDDTIVYAARVDQFYKQNGDNVWIYGGVGNDFISVYPVTHGVVEAGEGDDRISIDLLSSNLSITLGPGRDIITPLFTQGRFQSGLTLTAAVIEDFEAGDSGDRISLDYFLDEHLVGWNGSNPFANNTLYLVQSGTDTLLQYGSAQSYGTPQGVQTLVVLRNVSISSLTQDNIGFAPDGGITSGLTISGDQGDNELLGAGGADTIIGSGGKDKLFGAAGDDTLYGGSDSDIIDGGHSNDTLYGGDGNDNLYDGSGSDKLYGESGDDYLSVFRDLFDKTSTILIDGGTGNDRLSYSSNQIYTDNVTIAGGDGDDQIFVGLAGGSQIEAGSGNDQVTLDILGGAITLDLGSGADRLTLTQSPYAIHGQVSTIVVDGFEAETGDILDLSQVMSSRILNWDGTRNPFLTGHLRLAQEGADMLIQLDRTGGGDNFSTVVLLKNSSAISMTSDQLGWTPDAVNFLGTSQADVLQGAESRDIFHGYAGNDVIYARGGDDLVDGGEGHDTLVYVGERSQVNVQHSANGMLTVNAGAEGTDFLFGVENLQFNDGLYFTSHFKAPSGALLNNFAPAAGGWASQDLYPRHAADVNGDGYEDIVGFGQSGLFVSFGSANGSFATPTLVASNFGQSTGWMSDNQYYRELSDVNGDGRADVVGFGVAGTFVSLSQSNGTYTIPALTVDNFGTTAGWSSQDAYARTTGDVNGDGKADIIGFGVAGTYLALGNGDGTFGSVTFATANFGANQGWTSDNAFHRAVADINGDGKDDIVGFGVAGTYVALSHGDGTFDNPLLALAGFGKNQGWSTQDAFARDLADVNDDGFDDIVGFGVAGTYVSYGQANGSFSPEVFDGASFGANQGWTSDDVYYRELADINNDGFIDVIGFSQSGLYAGLNSGDFFI